MADFRKWFLALAVMALLVVPVSAQITDPGQFQCTASNAGVTPLLRAEGITEIVGDTVLQCTGGTLGGTVNVNIQVFLSGAGGAVNVTSKMLNTTTLELDALLIIDENPETALTGRLVPTVSATRVGNSVVWQNVSVPTGVPEGSTFRTIRLTNIRANASSLPASPTGVPTQITEFISISPFGTIPLTNPTITVGEVVPGLRTTVANAYQPIGITGRVSSILQCVGASATVPAYAPTAEVPTVPTGLVGSINFSENFGTAFKIWGPGPTTPGETMPGGVPFNTESGLVRGATIGVATQGTRLYATFANIPSGVSLYVSTRENPTTSSPTADATFVGQNNTVGGAGGAVTPAAISLTQLTVSGGAATAVWEITAASLLQETVVFDVVAAFAANANVGTLPTTFATVTGGFAPISTVFSAEPTSVAPIPRFLNQNAPAQNLFQVTACVTNLLFPYVVNIAGFDTGIAISNTSLDTGVFDTNTQHGPCTIYYFGEGAVPAQTTPDIAAGTTFAFGIGSGGVPGSTQSPEGFVGYIIARCNFQFAHGFAFVSDAGADTLSHGYLALVIPERATGRLAQSFSLGEASNHGEQLAQ